MLPENWIEFCQSQLQNWREAGRYRTLRVIESAQDTHVTLDGKKYLLFCSNNYLGLANHPAVKQAAIEAIERYGWGAGASRLISGNMLPYPELEHEIANLKEYEESLVFPTGYAANLGAITALVGKGDAVIIDKLNHASIVDACRQSAARLLVYEHCNCDDLRNTLKQATGRYNKILLVSDGVFSMDGDIAPMPELVNLAEEFNALLMIDDAHGAGVLGENGGGTAEYFGLQGRAGALMGTLSKAVGSLGGFIAGSGLLIDYLRNTARSLIYTTGLPPAACAASLAGLRLIKEEVWRRRQLWENVAYMKQNLSALGFSQDSTPVPIIPLIIGQEPETIALSNYLMEHGILIPPIRPPTVPKDKCRLRLTVMATHSKEEMDSVLAVLKRAQ